MSRITALCALSLLVGCGSDEPPASSPVNGNGGTQDGGKDGESAREAPDSGAADASSGGSGPVFVANYENGATGNLAVFAPPLSASSTPLFTLAAPNGVSGPSSVRVDPSGKRLWVANFGARKVVAFDLPLTTTSMPVTTLSTLEMPTDIRLDAQGNLFVSEMYGIEWWASPPQNAAAGRLIPTTTVQALAIDASGALYAAGLPAGGHLVHVFADPKTQPLPTGVTPAGASTFTGLEIVGTTMFASSRVSSNVVSYTLPLTTQSAPTTLLTNTPGWRLSLSTTKELVVPALDGTIKFLAAPLYTTTSLTLSKELRIPYCVAFAPDGS